MRSVLDAIGPRLRPSLVLLLVAAVVVALVSAPSVSATNTRSNGYWIALAHGDVNAYGDAPPLGGAEARGIVDLATTPTGQGYWLAERSGEILSIGDALTFAASPLRGGQVVAIGARPQGDGVWLLTNGGELLAYGAATAFAPLSGPPFTDLAVTPSGGGLWVLDQAGGVHVRGDAVAYGDAPGAGVAVAIAPTPSGDGYWVLSSTGAVTALGAAPVLGSATSGVYVDMAVTRSGEGYWLLDNLGRVTAFGDAVHYGDIGGPGFKSEPPVAIAVTPFVNLPPIAVDDVATLDEDTSVVVNVLANDSDPENDPLRVKIKFPPLHGTATVLPDQTISYVPAPNFNGSDEFTYEVDDGLGGVATAVVRLTVRPVNDVPVASDDAYATDEDTTLVVLEPGVLANDSDVDAGDVLSSTIVVGPTKGSLTLEADGKFQYIPAPNVNGIDTFRYRATDLAGASSEATVSIVIRSVPDAPVAVDDTYQTDEDTALVIAGPGVLANDGDADGDALAAILREGPSHGTLTLNANGSFAYTPAPDFAGEDLFRYAASDGGLFSGVATVRITVRPINDAPTASNDAYETTEDLPLDVAAPGVLGNDGDIDGDALTVVLVTGPTRGTLTLQPSGAFTYTPSPNANGTDSFTYRATDPSAATSAVATVVITIAPVPDAPVATNDSYTVANTATLNVVAPGVLGNDADADGDALSSSLVSGPAVGTLTLNTNGSFSYAPPAGHIGTVTFTYRASDGALTDDATVSISVTGSTGGGGGCCLPFSVPVPEIFDFESFNGVPATPGHVGRETLGGTQVEILGSWWLE